MNSKEALIILKEENLYLSNANTNEVLNAIEKDLEVLEILKKLLFIVEPDNEDDLKEFDSVDYLRLSDWMTRKEYQVVKEWLEE